MSSRLRADCVLVDLDGTLADTAPDMAAAVNRLLVELQNKIPETIKKLTPVMTMTITSEKASGRTLVGEYTFMVQRPP
jgi:phosphoglycolate phosphatase-like HAD superfamily hydrolase